MKRFSILCLAVLLLPITMLFGCMQSDPSNDKISVVCTIFPQYDWVRQILGDKADDVELTLLLDKKVDLHSYQPSVEDIATFSTCDLFIYVGGESDVWVEDTLKSATNKNMIVINLLEALGDSAKEEEIKEGMEHEHEHDEHDKGELDEHVWLSLKNAQIFCSIIADALSSLNADNAETYGGNLASYNERLSALDAEYHSAVNMASVKTLLFGDRFPFRYFVDDYGLNYHAAFTGCAAETEASFETIIFLARKVDDLSLKNIVVTESSDQSIAKTVKDNTKEKNQQILVLDSMQSVSAANIKDGTTYLSIMESNLNALINALN